MKHGTPFFLAAAIAAFLAAGYLWISSAAHFLGASRETDRALAGMSAGALLGAASAAAIALLLARRAGTARLARPRRPTGTGRGGADERDDRNLRIREGAEVLERLSAELAEARRARARDAEASRKERDFSQSIVRGAPSIIVGTDAGGITTFLNPAGEAITGLEASGVVGRPWWPTILPQNEMGKLNRNGAEAAAPGGDEFETTIATRSGARRVIAWHQVRLSSGAATDQGRVFMGSDVTERRVIEGSKMQAQKLESIGQLAAGIAHEINTPTQFVGDNLRFIHDALKRLLPDCGTGAEDPASSGRDRSGESNGAGDAGDADEIAFLRSEMPRAIEQALEGVERIARIVRAMKEFSHPDSDEMRCANLNRAIESTVTVARNEWKYVAEMELDLDPDLPDVPCLVGDFNQVVLNLVVNAAQAIKEGMPKGSAEKGRIRIETRREPDHAVIRVSDTGVGIPPEIRERIFDPFFTTKEVGSGSGQGLAIAHAVIVKKHRGKISVESERGRGATFIIRLPWMQAGPAEGPALEDAA